MAYADGETRRIKPAGLAAATLLNGGVVAALLLIAPQVVNGPVFQSTIIEEVTLDPPKPVVPDKLPPPRPIIQKVDVAPPTQVPVPVAPQPIVEPRIDPLPLILPPPVVPVAPIKPVLAPVLKAARPDPRYAAKLQPDYPPSRAREGMEGSVTVRVRIGADGRVSAVEVLRSDHEDFSRVTEDAALRKWRFIAATRDGAAVESWKEMTVRFQIPD